MMAPIGKIASPAQGAGYFEKDGCYAKNDGAHREASTWAGESAATLGCGIEKTHADGRFEIEAARAKRSTYSRRAGRRSRRRWKRGARASRSTIPIWRRRRRSATSTGARWSEAGSTRRRRSASRRPGSAPKPARPSAVCPGWTCSPVRTMRVSAPGASVGAWGTVRGQMIRHYGAASDCALSIGTYSLGSNSRTFPHACGTWSRLAASPTPPRG